MRCNAIDCWNNDYGYCSMTSYICIEDDGSCDSYYVPTSIPEKETQGEQL